MMIIDLQRRTERCATACGGESGADPSKFEKVIMRKKHFLHAGILSLVLLLSFVSCNQAAGNSLSSSGGVLSSAGRRASSSSAARSSSAASSAAQSSSAAASSSAGASSAAGSSTAAGSSAAGSSAASGSQGGASVSGKTSRAGTGGQNGGSAQPSGNAPAQQPDAAPAWPSGGGVPSPVYVPDRDGSSVYQNDDAVIDLSYTSYGFVKIRLTKAISGRAKVSVRESSNYYYDLKNDGSTEIYPLQMGSGTYTISVYEQASSGGYAMVASTNAPVSLISSHMPFLVPSQQVNYTSGSRAASIARGLVSGKSNNYERISAVLSYVAGHISYNYSLAKTVQSGYIPDIDADLASGSGICYDYAAVSAAMLRSLGYPTKLEMGWVDHGTVYHAWNEVYISGSGWVKVLSVTLNTSNWSRVDVTFISSSRSSGTIAQYIESDGNYRTVYTY